MSKTFHRKTDGSIVVKEGAKIIGNLPGKPRVFSDSPLTASIPKLPEKLTSGLTGRPLQQKNISPNLYYSEEIALLDEKISFLRESALEDPESVVLLSDLDDITVSHNFSPDSELTLEEALDLHRLEKAAFLDARTTRLQQDDKERGITHLHPFGDGSLGSAKKDSFYEPNTKEWLLARTQGIGGSDKLGYVDEYGEFVSYDSIGKRGFLNKILADKSPAAIAEITDSEWEERDEKELNLAPRVGNYLERTIQYDFAKAHPEYTHFEDKNTRTAEGRPWHRFNPDGVLKDTETEDFGVFEAKTSRDIGAFERALPGYLAQCLHNASAANLNFAVLVADIEGEPNQFVYRVDFTEKQLQDYRDTVDRAWLLHKPRYDKKMARKKITPEVALLR
jgi:hypothetical protein